MRVLNNLDLLNAYAINSRSCENEARSGNNNQNIYYTDCALFEHYLNKN